MREPDKCSVTADMESARDNLSERIATLEAENARLTRERDRLQATLGHAGLSDEAWTRIGNLVEDMVKRHSAAYALPTASPRVPPLPPGLGGTESEYLANIKAALSTAERLLASCGIKPREVPPNMPDRGPMERAGHEHARAVMQGREAALEARIMREPTATLADADVKAALKEPTDLPPRPKPAPGHAPRSPHGMVLVLDVPLMVKVGVWIEPAHWGPHATEVVSMTLPSEDDVLKVLANDRDIVKKAYAEARRG